MGNNGYATEHPPLKKLGPRRRYFPCELYKIVNDPKTNSLISWGEEGKSFIIWDPQEFSRDLLFKALYLLSFSLFETRLKAFGFKKVDSDSAAHFEYANDDFVRSEPKRALEIQKRYMQPFGPASPAYKPIMIEPAALEALMSKPSSVSLLPPGTLGPMPSLQDPVALKAYFNDAWYRVVAMPKDPLSAREKELAASLMPGLKDEIMRRRASVMEALANAGPSRD
ncbi:PREDICTED: heat stress transcription factor B-2b-like [Camelina sativa]|uniref:Heat stress transcription factor B-2b-like n=1 Tax=Camelina sativa TaxID=90675 RepID=A0ABM0U9K1_CAMSA|nr:PREDICTED: heat stress transcription factor B-2b-like [Camelina sativa]